MGDVNVISLPEVGAALTGLSALSAAAFGLLDATKAFNGGVSNIGLGTLRAKLGPFVPALSEALGPDEWWPVVSANWVAGVAKADQKSKVQALIRLGLSPTSAKAIAAPGRVNEADLVAAATKLAAGADLTAADLNVLGRMNATVDALMDAAFETADRRYKNWCRVLAGLTAVGLSIAAWALWPESPKPTFWSALAVGILAVPIAPVAKDLTSALSSAMQALKAARRL